MPIQRGRDHEVRYVEETTVGTSPTDPALLLFSKQVRNVSFFYDRELQEQIDISDEDVAGYFSTKKVYGVEVEFVIYDPQIINDLTARSNGVPKSYTLEIVGDASATPRYYFGAGWRPATVSVSGSAGEPYVATVTFVAGKLETDTTGVPLGVGSRQAISAITAELKHFGSGSITLDGGAWATLLDEFEFEVDHQAEAKYNTGSDEPDPAATSFGRRSISGTANVSMDSVFVNEWNRVDADTEVSIALPFGTTTGDDIVTFTARIGRFEVELTNEDDIIAQGVEFMARTLAWSTV